MSARGSRPIRTVEDLLAHAVAMESEAAERYTELADQLEMHHNHEVAELFRKMAVIEAKHTGHLEQLSQGMQLPRIAPWQYQWKGAEGPESIDTTEVHYRITPAQAVALALKHERKAAVFYSQLAADARREDVRKMATEFAAEEQEHVRWLEEWAKRYPPPEAGWEEDPDPPNLPE